MDRDENGRVPLPPLAPKPGRRITFTPHCRLHGCDMTRTGQSRRVRYYACPVLDCAERTKIRLRDLDR